MAARLKAFFIHLLCSVFVALAALFWVFTVWYPAPLHAALAVTYVFILLVLVDMTLGPVLTLIVFKSNKKAVFFDLSAIAVLQVSALIYGLWVVSEGRPAWVVFNVDRFDVVQVIDIDRRHLYLAEREYNKPSWVGPRWVGADRRASGSMSSDILFESAFGGPDIAQRPFLYRPLSEFKEIIRSRAHTLEQLARFNEAELLSATLAEWPQATGWVPLMARARPMVVLLSENNTKVLGIVDLRPWQ